MMKRGLIAALLTMTFAFMHVSNNVNAKVPILGDFPDVTIGDNPKVTPADPTSMGVFVAVDVLDVRDFLRDLGDNGFEGFDNITSPTRDNIKWSYFEPATGGGPDILVNGLQSLADGGLGFPSTADQISPPVARQLAGGPANMQGDPDDNDNLQNLDPGDVRNDANFPNTDFGGTVLAEDGDTYSLTFRDTSVSPLPFNIEDTTTPGATAAGTIINTRTLTIFASNFTTAAFKSFLVFTEFCSDDSITSTTIFKIEDRLEFDFIGLTADGSGNVTVGGVAWFGFAGGGTRTYDPARGLCMTVNAVNGGVPLWASNFDGGGLNAFDLVNGAVYKIRTFVNISGSPSAETQPMWTVEARNQNDSRGILTYGNTYWHFDDLTQNGGANIIGAADGGRDFFDDWWSPLTVAHTTWIDEAFSPAADPNNNWQLFWRVIDAVNDSIQTETRSGTICISRVRIDCVLFSLLDSVKVPVYDKPLHDGLEGSGDDINSPNTTHATAGITNVGSSLTNNRDISGGVATLSPAEATDTGPGSRELPNGLAGVELTPRDNAAGANPNRFFPIGRNDNELFMVEAEVSTSAAGNNPVAIVEIDLLARNIEAGAGGYVSEGQDIAGGMFRSASPKPTINRYVFFWYGNNASTSTDPDQRIAGHLFKVFNLGDLGGGSDPVDVHNLKVYRIDNVDLEVTEVGG